MIIATTREHFEPDVTPWDSPAVAARRCYSDAERSAYDAAWSAACAWVELVDPSDLPTRGA